jgi:hypothetical protein
MNQINAHPASKATSSTATTPAFLHAPVEPIQTLPPTPARLVVTDAPHAQDLKFVSPAPPASPPSTCTAPRASPLALLEPSPTAQPVFNALKTA